LADESATLMAEFHARLRAEVIAAQRARRRAIAVGGVIVLHILFIWLLILAQFIPFDLLTKPKIESLTWLSLNSPADAHRVEQTPRRDKEAGSVINPDVVPKILKPKEEENNAITDFGLALGRSLACGANSFEYLNGKMRMECRRKPWNFVYDRYGTIILDPQGRTPQEKEETLRPSDVQSHERNTAPRCPKNIDPNAPCLADIFGH
jgi:hypothetical protein